VGYLKILSHCLSGRAEECHKPCQVSRNGRRINQRLRYGAGDPSIAECVNTEGLRFSMNIALLWVVMMCGLVGRYQQFEGNCTDHDAVSGRT